VIWGFIGARLYHVLNEPMYYGSYPLEIFKIWRGGLAIHGAILAGVCVVFYFSTRHPKLDLGSRNKNKQEQNVIATPTSDVGGGDLSLTRENEIASSQTPRNDKSFSFSFLFSGFRVWARNDQVRDFFILSDLLVIGLALGQSIGRWGNYFNQELFGKPTDGFLKVFIDPAHRPLGFENIAYYHPTFLYESVLNFILFVVLYVIYTRICHCEEPATKQSSAFLGKRENDKTSEDRHTSFTLVRDDNNINMGLTTSVYFIGYGLIRFFIDTLRIDPRPFFGGLYLSQWVSLGMVVAGVWIWYNWKQPIHPSHE